MRGSPAGDEDFADAAGAQVLRRQGADIAGADHQHAPAIEPIGDLARDGYRLEADRHRAFAERRLGSDALADEERPIEEAAEQWSGAMPLGGPVERLFHLPEDLRLTDDGGIEPGGDAEQVGDGVPSLEREQMRGEELLRNAVELAQEVDDLAPGALEIVVHHVQLRTVARRQHHAFGHRRPCRELLHRRTDVAAREVQLLAQFDRSGAMAHAKEEQVHQNE